MKLYKAKVRLTTMRHDIVFIIPCVSSAKAAIDMVEKAELCPRRCLTLISLKELFK